MRLRQVDNPADRASWMEMFYAYQPLKVVNGIVETDNPNQINLLLQRGFRPIEEPIEVENVANNVTPLVVEEKKKEPQPRRNTRAKVSSK